MILKVPSNYEYYDKCVLEALLYKTREGVPGQKAVIAASSRGQGNAETDSAGHPVSPRTGGLQLSVLAGECLAQHSSKQQRKPS